MARKPKRSTGKKRKPMSLAHRKAISRALARELGPTPDYDPYEKKGRKTGKTGKPVKTGKPSEPTGGTSRKMREAQKAKQARKNAPKTVQTITAKKLPNNKVSGGGKQADPNFLNKDAIRNEPEYADFLDMQREIVAASPEARAAFMNQVAKARKAAQIDHGPDPENGEYARNRAAQRRAIQFEAMAEDMGLIKTENTRRANDQADAIDDRAEEAKKRNEQRRKDGMKAREAAKKRAAKERAEREKREQEAQRAAEREARKATAAEREAQRREAQLKEQEKQEQALERAASEKAATRRAEYASWDDDQLAEAHAAIVGKWDGDLDPANDDDYDFPAIAERERDRKRVSDLLDEMDDRAAERAGYADTRDYSTVEAELKKHYALQAGAAEQEYYNRIAGNREAETELRDYLNAASQRHAERQAEHKAQLDKLTPPEKGDKSDEAKAYRALKRKHDEARRLSNAARKKHDALETTMRQTYPDYGRPFYHTDDEELDTLHESLMNVPDRDADTEALLQQVSDERKYRDPSKIDGWVDKSLREMTARTKKYGHDLSEQDIVDLMALAGNERERAWKHSTAYQEKYDEWLTGIAADYARNHAGAGAYMDQFDGDGSGYISDLLGTQLATVTNAMHAAKLRGEGKIFLNQLGFIPTEANFRRHLRGEALNPYSEDSLKEVTHMGGTANRRTKTEMNRARALEAATAGMTPAEKKQYLADMKQRDAQRAAEQSRAAEARRAENKQRVNNALNQLGDGWSDDLGAIRLDGTKTHIRANDDGTFTVKDRDSKGKGRTYDTLEKAAAAARRKNKQDTPKQADTTPATTEKRTVTTEDGREIDMSTIPGAGKDTDKGMTDRVRAILAAQAARRAESDTPESTAEKTARENGTTPKVENVAKAVEKAEKTTPETPAKKPAKRGRPTTNGNGWTDRRKKYTTAQRDRVDELKANKPERGTDEYKQWRRDYAQAQLDLIDKLTEFENKRKAALEKAGKPTTQPEKTLATLEQKRIAAEGRLEKAKGDTPKNGNTAPRKEDTNANAGHERAEYEKNNAETEPEPENTGGKPTDAELADSQKRVLRVMEAVAGKPVDINNIGQYRESLEVMKDHADLLERAGKDATKYRAAIARVEPKTERLEKERDELNDYLDRDTTNRVTKPTLVGYERTGLNSVRPIIERPTVPSPEAKRDRTDNVVTFKKLDVPESERIHGVDLSEWTVTGTGLNVGDIVTAKNNRGREQNVTITQIVSDDNGKQVARFEKTKPEDMPEGETTDMSGNSGLQDTGATVDDPRKINPAEVKDGETLSDDGQKVTLPNGYIIERDTKREHGIVFGIGYRVITPRGEKGNLQLNKSLDDMREAAKRREKADAKANTDAQGRRLRAPKAHDRKRTQKAMPDGWTENNNVYTAPDGATVKHESRDSDPLSMGDGTKRVRRHEAEVYTITRPDGETFTLETLHPDAAFFVAQSDLDQEAVDMIGDRNLAKPGVVARTPLMDREQKTPGSPYIFVEGYRLIPDSYGNTWSVQDENLEQVGAPRMTLAAARKTVARDYEKKNGMKRGTSGIGEDAAAQHEELVNASRRQTEAVKKVLDQNLNEGNIDDFQEAADALRDYGKLLEKAGDKDFAKRYLASADHTQGRIDTMRRALENMEADDNAQTGGNVADAPSMNGQSGLQDTTPEPVDGADEINGRLWEKNGRSRTYINGWETAAGFEINRYKTGNISSAYFNGRKVSNNRASQAVAGRRVYVDNNTGELHVDGLDNLTIDGETYDVFDKIAAAIKASGEVGDMELKRPTPTTPDAPEPATAPEGGRDRTDNVVTFRRINRDEWDVTGTDLQVGDVVTARNRRGREKPVTITEIVTDNDGKQVARFEDNKARKRAPKRDTEQAANNAEKPARATQEQAATPPTLPEGHDPYTGKPDDRLRRAETPDELAKVKEYDDHMESQLGPTANAQERKEWRGKFLELQRELEAMGVNPRRNDRTDTIDAAREAYKPTAAEKRQNSRGLYFNALGAWQTTAYHPKRTALTVNEEEELFTFGKQEVLVPAGGIFVQKNGKRVINGTDVKTGKPVKFKSDEFGQFEKPLIIRKRPGHSFGQYDKQPTPQNMHATQDMEQRYPLSNKWTPNTYDDADTMNKIKRTIAEAAIKADPFMDKAPTVTDEQARAWALEKIKGNELKAHHNRQNQGAPARVHDSLSNGEYKNMAIPYNTSADSVLGPDGMYYTGEKTVPHVYRGLSRPGEGLAKLKAALVDDPDVWLEVHTRGEGPKFARPSKVEEFKYGYRVTAIDENGKAHHVKIDPENFNATRKIWRPLRHENGDPYTRDEAAEYSSLKYEQDILPDVAQTNWPEGRIWEQKRGPELDAALNELRTRGGALSFDDADEVDGLPDTPKPARDKDEENLYPALRDKSNAIINAVLQQRMNITATDQDGLQEQVANYRLNNGPLTQLEKSAVNRHVKEHGLSELDPKTKKFIWETDEELEKIRTSEDRAYGRYLRRERATEALSDQRRKAQEKTDTTTPQGKRHKKGTPFTTENLKDGETLDERGNILRGDFKIIATDDGYRYMETGGNERMSKNFTSKSLDKMRKDVDVFTARNAKAQEQATPAAPSIGNADEGPQKPLTKRERRNIERRRTAGVADVAKQGREAGNQEWKKQGNVATSPRGDIRENGDGTYTATPAVPVLNEERQFSTAREAIDYIDGLPSMDELAKLAEAEEADAATPPIDVVYQQWPDLVFQTDGNLRLMLETESDPMRAAAIRAILADRGGLN